MGTNYYLRLKPQEQDVHIGKSSCGWKFAFQIGGENCLNMGGLDYTRENAYKVIQGYLDKDYKLVDEYGTRGSLNELKAIIDSKTNEEEHYEDGECVRDEVVADGARWISTWFC